MRHGTQFGCLQVVRLQRRKWVEASTYPRFTLIGQSLGSMVLAWEALSELIPFLFVDTSGYAFTYVLARAAGSYVACYTHYPTISSDMLARVRNRASLYNNHSGISSRLVSLITNDIRSESLSGGCFLVCVLFPCFLHTF